MTAPDAAATIEATLVAACAAVQEGDEAGLLAMFHDTGGTFLFDYTPPRRIDLAELRTNFARSQDGLLGPMTCEVVEIETHPLSADAAWTASIMHVAARYGDGTSLDITYRATDVWRRIDGRWAVVHEHASLPVDPVTGRADLASRP